jgi:hypothetical protein
MSRSCSCVCLFSPHTRPCEWMDKVHNRLPHTHIYVHVYDLCPHVCMCNVQPWEENLEFQPPPLLSSGSSFKGQSGLRDDDILLLDDGTALCIYICFYIYIYIYVCMYMLLYIYISSIYIYIYLPFISARSDVLIDASQLEPIPSKQACLSELANLGPLFRVIGCR